MVKVHPTHKTRMSDSSYYDERCVNCGSTDSHASIEWPCPNAPESWQWQTGTRVRKIKGSSWQGRIVGTYSTTLTPIGYCVESENEPGSVQIYPASALELV